jgi:acetyl esterase/lipase
VPGKRTIRRAIEPATEHEEDMSSIPFGYLIPILLVGWCALFVLAPRTWPRPFGHLSYFFAVVNEVPFLAIFFLLGSTALAFSEGDIQQNAVGRIVFGLALAAIVALVAIIAIGFKAGPAIRHALDKELGAADTSERSPYSGRIVLWPLFVRRPSVEHRRNIRYGDAGKANLLDLYRHRSHPGGCPVLLHFHGGAFRVGKKDHDALPLLYHLASRGWLCLSANYRLRPATPGDQLIDVKRAIAWVRAESAAYGADPSALFVAGGSAGAFLAAMAGLTPNDPILQPGFESIDTSIRGAVGLYGIYEWPDRPGAWHERTADRVGSERQPAIASLIDAGDDWGRVTPLDCAHADAAPFFILHGDRDEVLPVEGARAFVRTLRGVSRNPVAYAELPGALHNFDLVQSPRSAAVAAGIERFARSTGVTTGG